MNKVITSNNKENRNGINIIPVSEIINNNNKSMNNNLTMMNRNNKKDIKSVIHEQLYDLSHDFADIKSLNLPNELENRMYKHQKEGVQWLYGLYLNKKGGILGDDMGLGKTFQTACLLTGHIRCNNIKTTLIISPVSVIESWHRELLQHLVPHVDRVRIEIVNSELSKKQRIKILNYTFQSNYPTIILTSYQLFTNMIDDFTNNKVWDYIILDEGHVIKNPSTKMSQAVHQIKSNNKLILTGTPIQNHLIEFYALVDWVSDGKVFGSKNNFISHISEPILKGQDPKASDHHRELANVAINKLLSLIRPILLQRKKCENEELLKLPSKFEVVIWIPLSTQQRNIYESYLKSRSVSMVLKKSTYPLEIINHLKTLCRHPFLIEAGKALARIKSGSNVDIDINDLDNDLDNINKSMSNININESVNSNANKINSSSSVFDIASRDPEVFELLQGSVKLRVLCKLCKRLIRSNHRVLVFSQSKLMIDIIQRVLAEHGMGSYRIDGTIPAKDRQTVIDEFNNKSNSPHICLLTTRACGYGITLTGADRVIIFDPSWNPAEDRQAVDRAYRIGQSNDVVVYRMIMAATVEEKMYEKQVFKDGVRVITESGESSRYFSSEETKALFDLGPIGKSLVMEKLWELSGEKMKTIDDTSGDLPGVLGFTRHDNLYNEVRKQNAINHKIDSQLDKPVDNEIGRVLESNRNKSISSKMDSKVVMKSTVNKHPINSTPINIKSYVIDLTSDDENTPNRINVVDNEPFSQSSQTDQENEEEWNEDYINTINTTNNSDGNIYRQVDTEITNHLSISHSDEEEWDENYLLNESNNKIDKQIDSCNENYTLNPLDSKIDNENDSDSHSDSSTDSVVDITMNEIILSDDDKQFYNQIDKELDSGVGSKEVEQFIKESDNKFYDEVVREDDSMIDRPKINKLEYSTSKSIGRSFIIDSDSDSDSDSCIDDLADGSISNTDGVLDNILNANIDKIDNHADNMNDSSINSEDSYMQTPTKTLEQQTNTQYISDRLDNQSDKLEDILDNLDNYNIDQEVCDLDNQLNSHIDNKTERSIENNKIDCSIDSTVGNQTECEIDSTVGNQTECEIYNSFNCEDLNIQTPAKTLENDLKLTNTPFNIDCDSDVDSELNSQLTNQIDDDIVEKFDSFHINQLDNHNDILTISRIDCDSNICVVVEKDSTICNKDSYIQTPAKTFDNKTKLTNTPFILDNDSDSDIESELDNHLDYQLDIVTDNQIDSLTDNQLHRETDCNTENEVDLSDDHITIDKSNISNYQSLRINPILPSNTKDIPDKLIDQQSNYIPNDGIITNEMKEKYSTYINEGLENELDNQLVNAAKCYINALDICNVDINLHYKLAYISYLLDCL